MIQRFDYSHNHHNNVCLCELSTDGCLCTCFFCTEKKHAAKELRAANTLPDGIVPILSTGFITVSPGVI